MLEAIRNVPVKGRVPFSPNGNPSFMTVYNLLDTPGFRLKVEQKGS
ncbi:MAG: hypothetical protein LBG43_01255 [Treponema sp.]|jgi:DNA-binding phage protein|nr:hypothetical protein [Treponema sp.]